MKKDSVVGRLQNDFDNIAGSAPESGVDNSQAPMRSNPVDDSAAKILKGSEVGNAAINDA